MLTSYGRAVSEELATWSYEGQGSFLFTPMTDKIKDPTGLFNLVTADLQADVRSVHIFSKALPRRDILMELAVKAAFHVGKTTDIVISHGAYGDPDNVQQRQYYLQMRLSRYLQMSFGRFLPAYGLNLDDHTALTRGGLGFGQGQESINLAVHFETETFQTSLTKVMGTSLETKSGPGQLSYETDVRDRYILRTGVKHGKNLNLGVSFLTDAMQRYAGVYGSYAPWKYLYLLFEYDNVRRMLDGTEGLSNLGLLRLGSELYRGVTLGLDLSSEKSDIVTRQRIGAHLYLMPTPHLSLRAEARREGDETNFIVMAHIWL